jgi:hypothetical protein
MADKRALGDSDRLTQRIEVGLVRLNAGSEGYICTRRFTRFLSAG